MPLRNDAPRMVWLGDVGLDFVRFLCGISKWMFIRQQRVDTSLLEVDFSRQSGAVECLYMVQVFACNHWCVSCGCVRTKSGIRTSVAKFVDTGLSTGLSHVFSDAR